MSGEYEPKKPKETKTGKIIHLAMAKGDSGIIYLMDWVWGDSIYDRLYDCLDEVLDEDKDEILEELEDKLDTEVK